MADESNAHSRMLSNRLSLAIRKGELEHVQMYIEQGVDVNRKCYSILYGEIYPLTLACRRGHEEIIEELLNAGAHPNQVSGMFSRPAMLIAAERRVLTLSMMRCLISHGVDVDFRDVRRRTILHYLAHRRFNDTRDDLLSKAKLVLDNGASVDARDDDDHTPLYVACRSGNIDLVKLFIAEGADVNCGTGDEQMLSWAADQSDFDMFDSLLNAGANRHLNSEALATPCDQNNRAMIILDTCDVDINLEMWEHDPLHTILLRVCLFCRTTSETVRVLLDRGADVRAVTDTGDTALHYAVMKCDCNAIRHLLSYNHPLNIKNNKNQTPLAKLINPFINYYSLSRQQADTQDQRDYGANLYQAGLLAFNMLVTAGAKVTADDEHKLNQLHIKHPEAQLPDYKISSTGSLKETCRFVIRGKIPVPVDVSLCKLPIPKLLQEYLNFPEFDPLVNEYNIYLKTLIKHDAEYFRRALRDMGPVSRNVPNLCAPTYLGGPDIIIFNEARSASLDIMTSCFPRLL